MLPLLTAPWALAALAALPALAALYWLRNTWREVPVSSLMFWLHQSESQASGLHMRRLQTPLLFFLEVAALLLLALAATGPRVDIGQGRWPLVVVLDDSFSMQAGGDESARHLAQAALERELRWGDGHPVRFILAGESAQLLGDTIGSWAEANEALEGWRCRAPTARLPQATALASELSGDKARILVISDHAPIPPGSPPSEGGAWGGGGRVQWWSFGKPRANLAFVNAARSSREGLDRCLLEVANFSPQPQSTTLVLKTPGAGQELHRETLTLSAHEIRRVILRLPNPPMPPLAKGGSQLSPHLSKGGDGGVVQAQLGDDALPFDNQVMLVREEAPPVRVLVQIKNDAMRVPMEKALQATGRTAPPGDAPQLLITDDADSQPAAADTWMVQLLAEKDADAFVGPFVLDRTHPLTEGLGLAGVIWGAGAAREFPGAPIVLAGSVPLVTDTENLAGQHHLRLRLRPDLSTLLEAPAWPIFVWNLVNWRAAELPGLRRVNLRLGESAQVTLPLGVESVTHIPPHGPTRLLPVHHQRVHVMPPEAGLHEIEADTMKYTFAVNVLRSEESDLTKCVTGRWGAWTEDLATAPAIYHLAWIPLLIVLGVLTLYMALAVRSGK